MNQKNKKSEETNSQNNYRVPVTFITNNNSTINDITQILIYLQSYPFCFACCIPSKA